MNVSTEKIWNDFHARLFGFILKRVHDPDTANDVLQDVFVKIHTKIDTIREEDKLTSWIYQITRNSILDYFKKKKADAPLSADLAQENEPNSLNETVSRCLTSMLTELSPEYRDALQQTELGTLSQKEYAEKEGISYSGAKSRVQRARNELSQLIQSCCKASFDKYGNVVDHQCSGVKCNCQTEPASF